MQTLEKNMNRSETKFKGDNMAVIDNVLKKYDTKATTKKTSMSVKFDTTLYKTIWGRFVVLLAYQKINLSSTYLKHRD